MTDKMTPSSFFTDNISFKNEHQQKQYDQWIIHSNLLQIRCISALTGIIYILAAGLDIIFAPNHLLSLKLFIHVLLLPLILFLITFLTFKKEYQRLLLTILTVAPILASSSALVILSKLDNPSVYLPEIYLILFWTFTVSGLPLMLATVSSLITVIAVVVSSYLFFDFSKESFSIHSFWLFAAFSFGMTGAYLLDKLHRSVFLTQLKLGESAVRDKLTGLYNRGKLDDLLQHAFNSVRESNASFGLIVIDIDDFKHVNDSYGHLAGDTILVSITQLLSQQLKETDTMIRWGGEEFFIISLETDHEKISLLVDTLRKKVEAYRFDIEETITVSIGFTLSKAGESADTLIRRADTALFVAKNSGKNCIKFLES